MNGLFCGCHRINSNITSFSYLMIKKLLCHEWRLTCMTCLVFIAVQCGFSQNLKVQTPCNKMSDCSNPVSSPYRVVNSARPHQRHRRASLRGSSMLRMQPSMRTWRPYWRVACRAERAPRPRCPASAHAPEPAAPEVSQRNTVTAPTVHSFHHIIIIQYSSVAMNAPWAQHEHFSDTSVIQPVTFKLIFH